MPSKDAPIHFEEPEEAGESSAGSAQQLRGGRRAMAGGIRPTKEEFDERDRGLGGPRRAMGPLDDVQTPATTAGGAAAALAATEDVEPTEPDGL